MSNHFNAMPFSHFEENSCSDPDCVLFHLEIFDAFGLHCAWISTDTQEELDTMKKVLNVFCIESYSAI